MGEGDGNGNGDGDERRIPERRAFFVRVRARENVVAVDFTRDGFRTVFAEFDSGDGPDESLRREAERLGYTVHAPGTGAWRRWRLPEWWAGDHGAVYVFRLDSDRPPCRP